MTAISKEEISWQITEFQKKKSQPILEFQAAGTA